MLNTPFVSVPGPLPLYKHRATRRRRGAATVELAICLPILLTVGLGMVELSNLIFIQTRIQAVAYESARYATRPTTSAAQAATNAQVQTYAQTMLAQLGITNATITITPSNLATATPGTLVSVAISAPSTGNSPTSYVLRNSMTLSTQTTLVVE